MSAINEFLIKSAGMEKAAKRGIVKYLERALKGGRWDAYNDPRVRQYVNGYLDHVSNNEKEFLSSLPGSYAKFLKSVSHLRRPKKVLGKPTGTFFGIYDASPVGSYASQSIIGTPLSRLRVNSADRNIFERLWDSKIGPKTRRWNVNDSYTDEDIEFLNSMSPNKAFFVNTMSAARNPMGEVVLSNNTAQRPRLIKSLEGYSNLGNKYNYPDDPNLDAIARHFQGHVYYGDNVATPELLRPDRLYHGGKELPDTPTYTGRNLAELDAPAKKGVMQDIADGAAAGMKPFARATVGKLLQAYAKHIDNKARGLSWYAMSPGQAMSYAVHLRPTNGRPYFIDAAAKRQLIADMKRVMDADYADDLWYRLQYRKAFPN